MIFVFELLLIISTFLLGYQYVLYPVLIVVLAKLFGKSSVTKDDLTPTVAVIVPAYNEANVIYSKIENILSLDYPANKISVWVGSDQSSDDTDKIVKNYNDERVHLWVAPKRGGKTEILNHLIPIVDSEIVFLTDANTMHKKDSLRLLVRHFVDDKVGAVAGHVEHRTVSENDSSSEEIFYRSFETRQKYLESLLHSTISAFGGFYVLRKALFKPIPHNSYSNDDVLIPMNVIRQGYRVVFDPMAVSEEEMSENVSGEFNRRVRIGAGNFQAFFWLLDFLLPTKGWPAFCYVSHKVTRWFSPFFIIINFISVLVLTFFTASVFYTAILAIYGILLFAIILYALFKIKLFRPIYYFFFMNVALFLGFFRYLTGIKSAVWSHTSRS